MPKCPECEEPIDILNLFSQAEKRFDFYLESDGRPVSVFVESFDNDSADDDYECPECNSVLFNQENDAIGFLEGRQIRKVKKGKGRKAKYYWEVIKDANEVVSKV